MSIRNDVERYIIKARSKYTPQTLVFIDQYLAREAPDKKQQRALIKDLKATPFVKKVYLAVAQIKPGASSTYAEIAEKIGHKGASRAVGSALKNNPYPLLIPCHRVIKSNGDIGFYNGPPGMKAKLLDFERSDDDV